MFCPNCGAKATENEKFCSSCGTALMAGTEKKNPEIKQVQEHHEIKAQPSAQQENKEKSKVDVNQLFSVNCNSKLNTFIIHNDSQLAYTLSKKLSKSSSGV